MKTLKTNRLEGQGKKILLSLIVLLGVISLINASWTSNLNTDLEGYWTMDSTAGGNVVDSLGIRNGVIINRTYGIRQETSDCKVSNCLYFDGHHGTNNDPNVNISNAHNILSSNKPFTVAFWQKDIEHVDGGNNNWITTSTGWYDEPFFKFYLMGTGGYKVSTGCWFKNSGAISVFQGPAGVYDLSNDYHYIVYTYNGNETAGGVQIYIDGDLWSSPVYDINTGPTTFDSGNFLSFGASSTGYSSFAGYMDEVGIWSRALTSSEVTTLYNGGSGITYEAPIDTSITITLNSPIDNYITNNINITFNCSATTNNYNMLNLTLFVSSSSIYSIFNSSLLNNMSLQYSYNVSQGINSWNCKSFTSLNSSVSSNRTVTKDLTSPLISISSPAGTYIFYQSSVPLALNWSVSDNINLSQCWYNYNSINYSVNCSDNSTTFSTITNINSLIFYANDTAGNINSTSTNWDYNIYVNSINYNSSVYETSSQSYSINLTYNNISFNSITSIFNFNSNIYTSTSTGSGDSIFLNSSFDIPIYTPSLIPFYWNISLANSTGVFYYSTPIYNVTNNLISFGLCNDTLVSLYQNFTFKDEANGSYVPSTINGYINYFLGSGSVFKTVSFQNTTENYNYGFCFSPEVLTIYTFPNIQYSNLMSVTRTFNPSSSIALTNSTTNTVLYLLSSSTGSYISFQVINQGFQSLSGVLVTATVTSSGQVAQSKLTDASGISTLFLSPNTLYTISATRTGYNSFSEQITPTQSTYTITMTSTQTSNTISYENGISYSINPPEQYLTNNTVYNFNITLSSAIYSLDSFGYNLTASNGSVLINQNSGAALGGTLSGYANTGNNTGITLNLYYSINGTSSYASKVYVVQTITNNGWSIYNGIVDLKQYINTGFFGLNSFGLNLIIFFIIFITSGLICYKFALYSPLSISVVITVLTGIFDVGLGLIFYDPTIFITKVPHIAFVVMAVITTVLFIKEGTGY